MVDGRDESFFLGGQSLRAYVPCARTFNRLGYTSSVITGAVKFPFPRLFGITSQLKNKKDMQVLGTCDPHTAPAAVFLPLKFGSSLPGLDHGDVYVYLVENPSPYASPRRSEHPAFCLLCPPRPRSSWNLTSRENYESLAKCEYALRTRRERVDEPSQPVLKEQTRETRENLIK